MSATPLLAGVAGEYYVAAEISRRGHVASITLRNTRGTDIVATNVDATRTITIQCKTSSSHKRIWILSQKNEEFISPTHFYVFVGLRGEFERPIFHIVPSVIVAEQIQNGHKAWLKGRSKNGKPHKDSAMRNFSDKNDEYLERWDLLGL
jgi:hypothetical protein